jgi:hypothetical protein
VLLPLLPAQRGQTAHWLKLLLLLAQMGQTAH